MTPPTCDEIVVPPPGLTHGIRQVIVRCIAVLDQRLQVVRVVDCYSSPGCHITDDDEEYEEEVLQQILVTDLDPVSLP